MDSSSMVVTQDGELSNAPDEEIQPSSDHDSILNPTSTAFSKVLSKKPRQVSYGHRDVVTSEPKENPKNATNDSEDWTRVTADLLTGTQEEEEEDRPSLSDDERASRTEDAMELNTDDDDEEQPAFETQPASGRRKKTLTPIKKKPVEEKGHPDGNNKSTCTTANLDVEEESIATTAPTDVDDVCDDSGSGLASHEEKSTFDPSKSQRTEDIITNRESQEDEKTESGQGPRLSATGDKGPDEDCLKTENPKAPGKTVTDEYSKEDLVVDGGYEAEEETEPPKGGQSMTQELSDTDNERASASSQTKDATSSPHVSKKTKARMKKKKQKVSEPVLQRRSSRVASRVIQTTQDQPNEEDLLASTDNLFLHANKEEVTVKDVIQSLEAEFGVTFTKPTKKIVKLRLVALTTGEVEPSIEGPEEAQAKEKQEDENVVSDVNGDTESSSDEEVEERDLEASDYEEEQRKHRKSKSSKVKKPRRRPPSRNSAKQSAVRIQAERLRKKRIQELQVRNEELQLNANKEDQKRAELIAAKFDTDKDELRIKRVEDRWQLLKRLDEKRLGIIKEDTVDIVEPKVDDVVQSNKMIVQEEEAKGKDESDFESQGSDSDDEDELEIIGGMEPAPLQNIGAIRNTGALGVLDLADHNSKTEFEKPKPTSPSNPNARGELRKMLLARQRKMGNMWLARELGYNNENEHLRDCLTEEEKKRQQVLQREQSRLQANERKQRRELLLQDDEEEEEFVDPNKTGAAIDSGEDGDSEVDEELALARELQNENAHGDNPEAKPRDDDNTESGVLETLEQNRIVLEPTQCSRDQSDDGGFETQPPLVPRSAIETDFTTTEEIDGLEAHRDEGGAVEDDGEELGLETQPVSVLAMARGSDQNTSNKDEIGHITPGNDDSVEKKGASGDVTEDTTGTQQGEGPDPTSEESLTSGDGDWKNDEDQQPAVEKDAPKEQEKKEKNAGWQAMLRKEAQQLKKMKKRKGFNELVEAEADEEEEEEEVAGLEDFGFSVNKKKKGGDDEEEDDISADKLNEDDLKHVVDDVSEDEGDEEAGEAARTALAKKEEKERHKEIMRRMREGYDGRRGGIAGGGAGARGLHRFDQLVAADNREDAKRLGLLNDDEVDSENEEAAEKEGGDEEDDEIGLLDKILKDRFLHRSSVELEENFSSDEEEEDPKAKEDADGENEDEEEKEQERNAKRFSKRARMQRLIDTYGDNAEFSQMRLIDEDVTMKMELQRMKNGLSRKRSVSSTVSTSTGGASKDSNRSDGPTAKRQRSFHSFISTKSSLSVALQASRRSSKKKTSFLGGNAAKGADTAGTGCKNIALNHVVFQSRDCNSRSNTSNTAGSKPSKRKMAGTKRSSSSLWQAAFSSGFH